MRRHSSTRRESSIVLTLCLLLGASFALATQKKGGASASASTITADKGRFTIQLNGQTVGHEEFEIGPAGAGWTARATTDLKPPDSPSTKVTGTLTLQPDGAPVAYEWTSHAEKTNGAHILFVNGTARITLETQGAHLCTDAEIKDPNRTQPCFFEQDMSFGTPLIAVLDNNLYHQYELLARVYDWNKAGAQTLPVLIPQELTPGSIKVESTGATSLNGKSYEGLRVTTTDLEVLLYLDSNHRLMRLEAPAAKVAVIRD